MPAFLVLALLSLLFGSGKIRPAPELRLFDETLKQPQRRWGAFFLSLSIHLLLCLAALPVADALSQPDEDDIYYRRFLAARAIVIRMPSADSGTPDVAESSRRPHPVRDRIPTLRLPVPPLQKPALAAIDRRFTPPPFWNRALFPPPPKTPAASVYVNPVTPAPLLETPPKLELPAPADSQTEALLTSSRAIQPDSAKQVADALADSFTGYPVHLFALAPNGAALPAAGSGNVGSAPEYGSTAPNALFGAGGSNLTSANPADRIPRPHEPLVSLLSLLPMLDTPVKMAHPNNGVFDVVVQSSAGDVFPESVGRMTGKPIYTVYLEVGGRKEWILQYCIPKTDGSVHQISANLVHLGNPAPVKAPYPLITVRPPDEIHRGNYLFIHGMVDTTGKFQELQIITTTGGQSAERILAYLAQWEFRPATQDGRPVLVEVILAVPPEPV